MEKDLINNLVIELRRGTLTLAILSALKSNEYGYLLMQTLENNGINIEANTLYPLLRRLEGQGLLESDWDTTESRPRKYYKTSELGLKVLEVLKEEWKKLNLELYNFMEDKNEK